MRTSKSASHTPTRVPDFDQSCVHLVWTYNSRNRTAHSPACPTGNGSRVTNSKIPREARNMACWGMYSSMVPLVSPHAALLSQWPADQLLNEYANAQEHIAAGLSASQVASEPLFSTSCPPSCLPAGSRMPLRLDSAIGSFRRKQFHRVALACDNHEYQYRTTSKVVDIIPTYMLHQRVPRDLCFPKWLLAQALKHSLACACLPRLQTPGPMSIRSQTPQSATRRQNAGLLRAA